MRLIRFFEETNNVISDLMNNRVDDRSDRERIEDDEDNNVYPNPLPVLSPRDPRFEDWMTRGDDAIYDYSEQHGLSHLERTKAVRGLGRRATLQIDQLISTERFLKPDGLERQEGDKFSSERPVIYKVDGNLLVMDGNHRIVQAHLNGQKVIATSLIDVDAIEARMSA